MNKEYNFNFRLTGVNFSGYVAMSISTDNFVWVTTMMGYSESDVRQKFADKYPYDSIVEITKKNKENY